MAVDILQIVQQFLCYGNNSCITEFSQYTFKPMEGLFYLVFFPIVFIIIFIFLLSNKLFGGHRGLKVLLSIAVFAFIILQGWYYMFMFLGKIWYIALIILGFFWLVLYGLRGGIGGGGGGGAQARTYKIGPSSILTQAIHALKDKALGVTGVQLEMLLADIETLRNTPEGAHGVDEITSRIDATIMEIRSNLPKYAMNRSDFEKIKKEYRRICKEKGLKINELVLKKAA